MIANKLPVKGNTFFLITFLIFLISGIAVPSDGNHSLLSFKGMAFILLFTGFINHLVFLKHLNQAQQTRASFFLFAGVFFLVWLFIGVSDLGAAVDQFKLFFITLFVIGTAEFLFISRAINFPQFLKYIIVLNFLYSLIKIGLFLGHIFNFFNALDLLNAVGFRYMAMGVLGNLGRLQTSVDLLIPFLLYFILQSHVYRVRISRFFKILCIFVAWISIAMSFSRFLMMAALSAHLFYWLTEIKFTLFFRILSFALTLGVLIFLAGPERISGMIEARFFSVHAASSDNDRATQIDNLFEEFSRKPLLGTGLGGYAENGVRDDKNKYNYEVQWVSFLMQFGLLGFLGLLMAVGIIALLILFPPLSMQKVSLFLMYLLWLLSGFTNPFLISITSGIIYTLFLQAAHYLNKSEDATLTHYGRLQGH